MRGSQTKSKGEAEEGRWLEADIYILGGDDSGAGGIVETAEGMSELVRGFFEMDIRLFINGQSRIYSPY